MLKTIWIALLTLNGCVIVVSGNLETLTYSLLVLTINLICFMYYINRRDN